MKTWKKYLTVAASALALVPAGRYLYACADIGGLYEEEATFFLDDVSKDAAFLPFHYTLSARYFDMSWSYIDTVETRLPDENIAAWQSIGSGQFTADDAAQFIYRYPYSDLKNLYFHLEKNQPLNIPAAMQQNSFTRWISGGRRLEDLGYLMYAKQCEVYAAGTDEWSPPERDTTAMGRLIKNGLQLHAAAKAPAIRDRYAFQIIRLALFAEQYRRGLVLYKFLVTSPPEEKYIAARIEELYGGLLFRTRKNAEAAYHFSKAFDLSDNRKRPAMLGFDWAITGGNTAPVLALCQTNHEKAVVHVMDAMLIQDGEQNDMLGIMRQAYALDPAVRGLNEAMTRELNRLEALVLAEELYNSRNRFYVEYDAEYGKPRSKAEQQKLQAYISELADFAAGVAKDSKAAGGTDYWWLANAYLHYLNTDFSASLAALDQLRGASATPRIKTQQEIIRSMVYIRQGMDSPTGEAEVLQTMRWLDEHRSKDWRLERVYRNMLQGALASSFLKNQDTADAVLALGRLKPTALADSVQYSDYYDERYWYVEDFTDEPGRLLQQLSLAQYAALEHLVAGGGKTAMQQWLLKKNPYTTTVLQELKGTRYLRMLDFTKAAATLEQVPESVLRIRPLRDPFVFKTHYYQEWSDGDSSNVITKKDFARDMAGLAPKVASGNASDDEKLRYGLGLYAMTYYGRAAKAYTYYRSGSDEYAYYVDAERKKLSPEDRNYYGATAAADIFDQLYANATDPNIKLRAAYMAALCWQANIPAPPGDRWDWSGQGFYNQAMSNPWLPRLASLRSAADFGRIATECSYLEDYLRRKR